MSMNIRKRDASVDALRCLLMFLIVLHHSQFHGYWGSTPESSLLPFFFTLLTFWHVDGFIAISGWYGIRFSFTRFFKLLGVMAFYSIPPAVYNWLYLHKSAYSSIKLYGGWFGHTYLAFMFLAPLLDVAVKNLVTIGRSNAYRTWIVFNIGMVLNWFPLKHLIGVSAWGGDAYSILTFILVYVNARMFKELGLLELMNWKRLIVWGFGGYILGILLFSLPNVICASKVTSETWLGYTSYNAPYCVAMSLAVLCIFVKFVRLSNWITKICLCLSPHMFGVYLIHEATGLGRGLYKIPEKWLACHTDVTPFLCVFASAVLTFAICVIIDIGRSFFMRPFIKFFIARLSTLDAKFDSFMAARH